MAGIFTFLPFIINKHVLYFSSSKTMFALNFANIVIIGSSFLYKIDTGNKNKRSFKNIVCVYSQTTFFTTYVSEKCHLTIQTTFFSRLNCQGLEEKYIMYRIFHVLHHDRPETVLFSASIVIVMPYCVTNRVSGPGTFDVPACDTSTRPFRHSSLQ